MNFYYTELFNYFGGIMGLIVAVVILTFSKRGGVVRVSLSLFLITSSLIVILGALNYSGKVIQLPFLIRVDSPLHFLFGPVTYFYILSSLKTNFRFRSLHFLHLLPFLLNFLFFLPLYLESNAEKVLYYQSFLMSGSYGMPFQYLLKTLSVFLYLCLQIYQFIRYYPNIKKESGSNSHSTSWYYIFLTVQFLMVFGLILDNLTDENLIADPYPFAMNMVTLFLFLSTFALLFFPQVLYGKEVLMNRVQRKYHSSNLSNNDKHSIMDSLNSYMNSKNRPFSDPELSLNKLSGIMNINSHQLSQVINERNGMNFNDYVNQYRIDYAKKLLISPDYQKFTIDTIGKQAGFNSRSPFYKAFKKATGLTPRQYILNAQKGIRSIS